MNLDLVHLIPHLQCNLTCTYCYVAAKPEYKLPSLDRLKGVCGLLNQIDYNVLHIEGGEPFVDEPSLHCILDNLNPREGTTIVTNGTLVTDELSEKCLARGFNGFIVSVDGGKFGHEAHRGPNFDLVTSNVESLIRAGARVAISTTLTREAVASLDEMFNILSAKGVRDFRLGDVVPVGRANAYASSYLLKTSDYQSILQTLQGVQDSGFRIAMSLKPSDVPPFFEQGIKDLSYNILKKPCYAANNQFCVTGSGSLYSCYNVVGMNSQNAPNVFDDNIAPDQIMRRVRRTHENMNCPYFSTKEAHFYSLRDPGVA